MRFFLLLCFIMFLFIFFDGVVFICLICVGFFWLLLLLWEGCIFIYFIGVLIVGEIGFFVFFFMEVIEFFFICFVFLFLFGFNLGIGLLKLDGFDIFFLFFSLILFFDIMFICCVDMDRGDGIWWLLFKGFLFVIIL